MIFAALTPCVSRRRARLVAVAGRNYDFGGRGGGGPAQQRAQERGGHYRVGPTSDALIAIAI